MSIIIYLRNERCIIDIFLHKLIIACTKRNDFMSSKKKPTKNFFHPIKGNRSALDELSLFLITIAFITAIIMIFLILTRVINLSWFILLTWIPILIAYWRPLSKNRAKRAKENQIFIKYYAPIKSFIKSIYQRISPKYRHIYLNCKKCKQQLRIPKKTGHIKVTCPKCYESFIKKTVRGHFNKSLKR